MYKMPQLQWNDDDDDDDDFLVFFASTFSFFRNNQRMVFDILLGVQKPS